MRIVAERKVEKPLKLSNRRTEGSVWEERLNGVQGMRDVEFGTASGVFLIGDRKGLKEGAVSKAKNE
jgi:hypothetical protein